MAPRNFRPQRMTKFWDGNQGSFVNVAANSTFAAGTALAFTQPATLLRWRQEILIAPDMDGTLANNDVVRLTFGLAKLSTDNVAVGAAGFPDPDDEPEYPWLHYFSRTFGYGATFSETMLNMGASTHRELIDSKTMRKIRPGESIVWVGQYVNISGTPPIDVSFGSSRCLLAS